MHELKYILGVVLSTDVGMKIHIKSSIHVNYVAIMDFNGSYFFDDDVSLASGSTRLRMFYFTAKYKIVPATWARQCITT